MLEIYFKPSFIKSLHKYDDSFVDEIIEKIELFKNPENHKYLKVHKLHGRISGVFSFSVNYKVRIVFKYMSKNEVVFMAISDHEIYK